MSLLTLHNVNLEFGEQVIFRNAEFVLEAGERVCLIGRNGAGKSTLLRLISGAMAPDSGEVRRRADVHIAQLEQTLPTDLEISVSDYVAAGLATHQALIDRYHEVAAGEHDASTLRDMENLQRRIEIHGGWDIATQVATVTTTLELPTERRLGELSGGWQRRVALARALVSKPDILLLDEPTNHLDLDAIEWLENRVRSFPGSVLFITHDRAFLQALATRIVDIDRGQLKSWPGNYQRYLKLKDQTLEDESRHNALFDKKLAEEERWIRQGIKARRTRNEGRVRALEQLRETYRQRIKPEGKARIVVQDGEQSSRRVIQARNLSYAYGATPVIKNLSLKIMRGDRIGLIGNNGVGKSTLLRLLLGDLEPQTGTLKRGENLNLGYFDQMRRDLDPRRTVADIVGDGRDFVTINGQDRHVVGYLRGFLFSAKRAMTPVGFLSGGECNRVILARLFTRPTNLLVLDEPTNDLDVETLEVLEAQLAEYQGTLIVVSHDRTFLDNVVTSTVVFERDGEVRSYPGGFSDWLRHGRTLAASDVPLDTRAGARAPTTPASSPPGTAPAAPRTATKLSYKLRYELDKLPAQIEQLEARIKALENEIASNGFYERDYAQVQPVLENLERERAALDQAMTRWDELESQAGG